MLHLFIQDCVSRRAYYVFDSKNILCINMVLLVIKPMGRVWSDGFPRIIKHRSKTLSFSWSMGVSNAENSTYNTMFYEMCVIVHDVLVQGNNARLCATGQFGINSNCPVIPIPTWTFTTSQKYYGSGPPHIDDNDFGRQRAHWGGKTCMIHLVCMLKGQFFDQRDIYSI